MARKKITIRKDIKNDFITDNYDIQDISLVIELKSQTRSLKKIDLSKHLLGLSKTDQIKRRKEFSKIVAFAKNTRRTTVTLSNMLQRVNSLITLSDQQETLFFEDKESLFNGIKHYKNTMKEKVLNKEISLASVNTFRSQLFSFLIDCFGYEEKELQQHYPKINQRTGKLKNATILDSNGDKTVYTKEEYKKLLSILIGLSKHCDYLIENNLKGLQIKDYPFELNDYKYQFRFGNNYLIKEKLQNTKSMFLLFAFIGLTGSNLTPALLAKRSDITIVEGERDLLHLILNCKRKSKVQQHKFILKKYQKQFFDYIIEHSKSMNQDSDAFLFPYINPNTSLKTCLNEILINGHYKKIIKDSNILVEGGEPIKISARALRSTYASFFNDVDLRSAALFNSPETAAKHYADSNFKETNNNLQNAMNIYTISLQENKNISDVKQELINVKELTEEDKKDLKLSSNGLFCVNSSGSVMEQKFKRKLKKSGFENENISCSNLLACFQCENAALSDYFESVYLLISLRDYLNESIYDNECSGLFGSSQIVKESINNIDMILKEKINKKTLKEVNLFIKKNGCHPLWQKL